MKIDINKSVNVYRIHHRGAFRLGIYFDYNQEIHSLVKRLGAKWSQSKKCWYLDDEKESLPKLSKAFKNKVWLNYKEINSKLSAEEKQHYFALNKKSRVEKKVPQDFSQLPNDYRALLERKRYSKNTQRTYISMFSKFMEYFKEYKLDEINDDQIKTYLNYLITKKKVSSSYQNQMINSIKFYYEHALDGQRKTYRLDRPRKTFRLPTILSDKEVIMLLSKIKNLKHLCIAAILYSSGLRRGEIINIRKGDIDLDRLEIKIRAGKGNKDRIVGLSENVALLLVKYVEKYKPTYWLFEGEQKMKYSASSVSQIIKRANKAAGIAKNISPHVLRHSYATHMVEQGVDIIHVQKLLGHNSVKTTQIYTHVSNKTLRNIKSPLDRIISDRKLDNNNLNNY